MKKVIKIDENGLFIEDVIVDDNFKQTENLIVVDCLNGFYHPKWDGEKWIEGLTSEEITALNSKVSPKTELEILKETVDTLILASLGGDL